MPPAYLTITLSIFSIIIATFALFFALRKDAHHVRLELSAIDYLSLVLGVNNDSAVAFGILSIGYFQSPNHIEWIKIISDHNTNKFISYPIKIEPRSLFPIELCPYRNKIPSDKFGVCVQLETGRVYILNNTLPLHKIIKLQISAFILRFSRGRYAPGMPPRPRLPINTKNYARTE